MSISSDFLFLYLSYDDSLGIEQSSMKSVHVRHYLACDRNRAALRTVLAVNQWGLAAPSHEMPNPS